MFEKSKIGLSRCYLINVKTIKDKILNRKIFPSIWFWLLRIPAVVDEIMFFKFFVQNIEIQDFSMERYNFIERDKEYTLIGFPLTSVKNHIFLRNQDKKLFFDIYFFLKIAKILILKRRPRITTLRARFFRVPGIKIYVLQ